MDSSLVPGGSDRPHVVIVGGGFGGLQAAQALRKAPVWVTLIDRSNHHLFQPLLCQVATAGLSPGDIAAPIRSVLRDQPNARVVLAEVVGVDSGAQNVLLDAGTVHYDFLVLATGARESYFGHEEWAQHAPGLKSLADALAIRRDILLAFEQAELESDPQERAVLLTFVLVGAGPTGVEMAGAIAELAHSTLARDFRQANPRSARILLLEAAPRILGAFPEGLARKAEAALRRMGVEVRTGTPVEQVDCDGVVAGGDRIRARKVLWTAGIQASPAGAWLSAKTDRTGRVGVQPDLSVDEHPEVFVIGDAVSPLTADGCPLPCLAPVATQEGRYVADVIRRRVLGRAPPEPFRYHHRGSLATVGRSFAVVDLGLMRVSGFPAWVLWLAAHIFFLIGFRNRLLVMIEWAWAYFTRQRGVRLITSLPEHAGAAQVGEPR